MKTIPVKATAQVIDTEGVGFAGGELEGKRPRVLCAACRARLHREANSPRTLFQKTVQGVVQNLVQNLVQNAVQNVGSGSGEGQPAAGLRLAPPICFQCYRAELERERALKEAGELDTASAERFQSALPLEPVNHARLARLKVERRAVRASQAVASPYVDRRRQAQINARHVLQRLAEGLRARAVANDRPASAGDLRQAEMRLPEAWLPFVASR